MCRGSKDRLDAVKYLRTYTIKPTKTETPSAAKNIKVSLDSFGEKM